MSLKFIGEMGVYFPDRDAIRITALTPRAHIGCFATRAALGCLPGDPPQKLIDRFEANRIAFEIAAMIKYRRSTSPLVKTLVIDREDLSHLESQSKSGSVTFRRSVERPGTVRRRPAHLRRSAADASGEDHRRRP